MIASRLRRSRKATRQRSQAIFLDLTASRALNSKNQISSSRIVSAPIATSDASRNVAENVPRLILLAIDASVSCKPCFLSRWAKSRYPTSARASSAFKSRLARSSQEGGFVAKTYPQDWRAYNAA